MKWRGLTLAGARQFSLRAGPILRTFHWGGKSPRGAQVSSMGAKCDFQFMQRTPTEEQITNEL